MLLTPFATHNTKEHCSGALTWHQRDRQHVAGAGQQRCCQHAGQHAAWQAKKLPSLSQQLTHNLQCCVTCSIMQLRIRQRYLPVWLWHALSQQLPNPFQHTLALQPSGEFLQPAFTAIVTRKHVYHAHGHCLRLLQSWTTLHASSYAHLKQPPLHVYMYRICKLSNMRTDDASGHRHLNILNQQQEYK